eukprot:8175494-Pyramimonas_sp.AAC.1
MTSATLETDIQLTRLGSGHRMATIVQALEMPLGVPESALRKYPFLSQNSFQLNAGDAPEML